VAKIPPKKPAKSAPAKPGKDVIYLDVDDEITSIIEKVEDTKQKIVALVLPKRAAMLQSIVNMRLLKRSAASAGKNVVLITSEHALMPLAGAAGIHVAKNLQSKPIIPPTPHGDGDSAIDAEESADGEDADSLDDQPQKLDYNSSVGALAAAHDEPEEIALDNDDEDKEKAAVPAAAAAAKHDKGKGRGLKVPNFDRFRMLLIGGGAALIALVIFLILATTVLPKATVTIKTTSTPVSLDIDYTASGTAKELDENKKIIPAVLKTSDQTSNQQVNATGQQNNGEKASGTATLKNCSNNPVTLPAGTGVGASGTNFITQKTITLNSGNFTGPPSNACKNSGDHVGSVSVAAQSPGTKYNVNDLSFTASGGVTGSVTASGGTDNNITILTQQAVDGAKAKISSADSDKFAKDFQKQLSDQGLYVINSTLKVNDPAVTSTPSVGQQASTASVNVKITYSVIAVQKNNLEQAVKDALNKKIDQKKEKLSDSDVLKDLTITVQNQQPNSPNATLALSKDTTAVPIIDEDGVKAAIRGKKENQIKAFLTAYPGVKDVEVKFSPFWVSSAPNKTSKIKIVEQQVKSDTGSGQ
jgi:hypothetical protein